MKATAPPAKRRRGPLLAVLALVFCSLLVPIAFLFNRFPAGEYLFSPPRIPGMRPTPRLPGSDRRRHRRICSGTVCLFRQLSSSARYWRF